MRGSKNKANGNYWISVSDMMSGLMMVFLFIAISYMIKIVNEKETIEEIAITYNRLQDELYEDLHNEFAENLEEWGGSLDRATMAVRFHSPEILFEQNSDVLKLRFKVILESFFSRYVEILTSEKYAKDIEEIRIEGHTSSEWRTRVSDKIAYINNMKLSQDRTRSVLNYIINLPYIEEHNSWVREHVTANGLSSSKLIINNGVEDMERSRRVEFRIKTNAEKKMLQIIKQSK